MQECIFFPDSCMDEIHMQYENFRGVRQILKHNYNDLKKESYLLDNTEWINNLRELENKNLSFDLLIN